MKIKSYVRILNKSNRVRNRFEIRKGDVVSFLVQYETKIKGEWHSIVRYDTAHGFAHKDLLHPFRKQQKIDLGSIGFNEVLTYAQNDINLNWKTYLKNYLKEFKQ